MARQLTLNERINLRGNLERFRFHVPLIRVHFCYELAGKTPSKVVGALWPPQPRKYRR